MSDGPYRSLPMSRSWKRLAAFAEKDAFGSADICAAAAEAMEKTCRTGIPPALMSGLRSVFLDQQAALFSDQRVEAVETLRPLAAGHAIGNLLLDHAVSVLQEGAFGESGLLEGARRMLTAVGSRATRQMEEHYIREASTALTKQVRSRVQQALDEANTPGLGRQLCGLESAPRQRGAVKHKSIDDGVPL